MSFSREKNRRFTIASPAITSRHRRSLPFTFCLVVFKHTTDAVVAGCCQEEENNCKARLEAGRGYTAGQCWAPLEGEFVPEQKRERRARV